MRILSFLTNYIRSYFVAKQFEGGYRHLMLLVSMLVSIPMFLIFAYMSFINNSETLSIILISSSIINILNITLLLYRKTVKFSSYLFIVTYTLTLSYVIFDSGRYGFGYLWFYSIPAANLAILGARQGTLISLLFWLYLIVMFYLPTYILDDGIVPELKPRLLLSYFALVILLFFREWTIELFRKEEEVVDATLETDIENSRSIVVKLSNQIRNITNDILESVNEIKRSSQHSKDKETIENINDGALNLINVINSLGEYSEFSLRDKSHNSDYNLFSMVDKTIRLFDSYKPDISFVIDKSLPAVLYGNPLIVKQIVYNILEKFISSNFDSKTKIELDVQKGAESLNYLEIRYVFYKFQKDKLNDTHFKRECKGKNIVQTEEHGIELIKMGLESLVPLVQQMGGRIILHDSMQYLSLCFNQKIVKDMHYKSETIAEQSYALSSFNSQALDHLSRKRLSKMRVLLMEDNPITQKSILFALDKTVKQLDMASNGREGLDLFFKNKYDLILLDINMPVMDGYEVALRIRTLEQGLHIHIPIIAIISDYLAKDVEKIIEGGIDDFIGKPFKTADLIKKLNLLSNREKE